MVVLLVSIFSCQEKRKSFSTNGITWINSNINLHRGTSANSSLSVRLYVYNQSENNFTLVLKEPHMSYLESNLILVFKDYVKNRFDTLILENGRGLDTLTVTPQNMDSISASTIFLQGKNYDQIDSNAIRIAFDAQLLLKTGNKYLKIERNKDYSVTHDTGFIDIME